ncbi:MAG: hypothetical protein [Olavius algarvensis Gamma 1 endosymbiont]|nr:MAG: hypothetical protein [Olavius algarvensis Gamma 1 endosymbiont]
MSPERRAKGGLGCPVSHPEHGDTLSVRGKRGRGAGGKMIVFGILRRQGKVYMEIVPAASKKQLQGAIRGKVGLA